MATAPHSTPSTQQQQQQQEQSIAPSLIRPHHGRRPLARVIAAVDHLHRRDRLLIQLSISCHLLSSTRPTDKLPHRLIYCIRQVAPMCTRRIVHVHWAHISLSPKSILIGSAVLQGSLGYQTNTQADTHTPTDTKRAIFVAVARIEN